MLVLVGTKKAVAYAVKHITVTKRNTKLKERLKNGFAIQKVIQNGEIDIEELTKQLEENGFDVLG